MIGIAGVFRTLSAVRRDGAEKNHTTFPWGEW
jgi:hypothetical protein